LAKAPKLRVIGRAGVGVDNVDLDAATAAGVLVMNTRAATPSHVSRARARADASHGAPHPAATISTNRGSGERRKFLGSELRGKTLGIVGLGSIGREVVKRARAFEMRILAHDPTSPPIARDLNVELVSLQDLYEQGTTSLHVSLSGNRGLLSRDAFAWMKPGFASWCARGG
jgi:phosphoglycerate dehydrogenase-like enzyme